MPFLKTVLILEKLTCYVCTEMPDFWPSYEMICQTVKQCSVPRLLGIKMYVSICLKFSEVLGLCSPLTLSSSDLICISQWISEGLFRCHYEGGDSLVSVAFISRVSFFWSLLFFPIALDIACCGVAQPRPIRSENQKKRYLFFFFFAFLKLFLIFLQLLS